MMKRLKEVFTQQQPGDASPAIMGVCSYIANRFQLDVLAVRITVAGAAYFTSTSKAMLAYIALGVLLSISGEQGSARKRRAKKGNAASNNPHSHQKDDSSKECEEPSHSAQHLSRTSVQQLNRKLARLDSRLAQLESGITSNHLEMARAFRELREQTGKAGNQASSPDAVS